MLDLAAGIEDRNYGLKKTTDPRTLLESLKIVLPLMALAGALSFQIWARSQSINIGYESLQLSLQEKELERFRQQLILEEQILKNPRSLEAIARNNLGMRPLGQDQIITSPVENWDVSNSETLALGNPSLPSAPKNPSAFNGL